MCGGCSTASHRTMPGTGHQTPEAADPVDVFGNNGGDSEYNAELKVLLWKEPPPCHTVWGGHSQHPKCMLHVPRCTVDGAGCISKFGRE